MPELSEVSGVDVAVLDAGAAPGGAWSHRWPSLRLGTTHHLHDLPGLGLSPEDAARAATGARELRCDHGRHQRADLILWCTGFRRVIEHLASLRLREPGGGIRTDGTRVVREPRLHHVGYGPSASTIGATRAGRAAVRDISSLLQLSRRSA